MVAAIVAATVAVSAVVAPSVGADDPPKMDHGAVIGWEFQTGRLNDPAKDYPCTAQVMGWARELGISGVQRIRIHFELYGPYAEYWMPSERSSNQVAYPRQSGGEFPDDFRSYWLKALMPWGLWSEEAGDQLVMDYVGERPSFWKPDIHEEVLMGKFSCEFDEMPTGCNSEGPLRCPSDNRPLEEPGTEVTGAGGTPGLTDTDQDGIDDSQDGIDDIRDCPFARLQTDPVTGDVVCNGTDQRSGY